MKKLNRQATNIFYRLLTKLGKQQHVKLESTGFMPLDMEMLQENILTSWGVAASYSLCHSYLLNGDVMRDPEMVFIVIDNRKSEKDFDELAIYPQMFQQDNLGIYEESITIDNGQIKSFIKTWQHGHCNFANIWLKNIKEQGFLK